MIRTLSTTLVRPRLTLLLVPALLWAGTARAGISFKPAMTISIGNQPVEAVVTDVNLDGKKDIVLPDKGNDSVSIFLGLGNGTFDNAPSLTAGGSPDSVALGDVDGDAIPDLVVANQADDTVSIFLGRGDGSFTNAKIAATGQGPKSVRLADVNGDGFLDIVVADFSGNAISILIGKGDGTFLAHTDYASGPNPNNLAIGDLNGDGKPDIVTANDNLNSAGNGSFSVLLNNGSGQFPAHTDIKPGGNPQSVALGDTNADGKLDLAVDIDSGQVALYPGNGNGTFGTPVKLTPFGAANTVLITDVNADSKQDLLSVDPADGVISVFLGDGSGSFPAHVDFLAGNGPRSLGVGDFSSDGLPDLVVANPNANAANILINTGDNNQAPVAVDGQITGIADDVTSGVLQGSDPDGNPITFIISQQPAHGTVGFNSNKTGLFIYQPNTGFVGTDTFKFKVNDGQLDSPAATETAVISKRNTTGGGNSGPFELGLLGLFVVAAMRRRRPRR